MSRQRPYRLLVTAFSLVLLAIAALLTTRAQNAEGSLRFSPQSHRRFINIGATGGAQLTEEEFRFLAENFDYVLLEKHHGGFDIELHHEVAHRLEELNPAVWVLPYFSTKYWFTHNDWGGRPFDPAWYLRDNRGNIIYRARHNDRPRAVPYVDLANPEYRAWALDTLRSWLEAAPYDGIFFDAAEPIGDHDEAEAAEWRRRLGQNRVKEYNAGMRTLLASAQRLVGPDQEIIFNGIAPSPLRGPDRNLDLLDVTDGALNERFCLDIHGDAHVLEEDLELMGRYDDRRLFLRTTYHDRLRQNDLDRERYGRFCLGAFLLGWQPGSTYFQFGGVTTEQLHRDLVDINIPMGLPVGPYQRADGVLSRSFANGEVYVNADDQPVQVTLSRALVMVQAGQELAKLEEGDIITIPPWDAAFLLQPDFLVALKADVTN